MYGKFEGFPEHISELFGLVSYNDPCFRFVFGCRCLFEGSFFKDHSFIQAGCFLFFVGKSPGQNILKKGLRPEMLFSGIGT